jgi:aspartate racemase
MNTPDLALQPPPGRLLGMLGGLSWASTLDLYRRINEGVAARRGGLHSARLLLHSVDFAPIAQAMSRQDWPAITATLTAAAQGLAAGGAQALMVCSNTMHQVAPEVARQAGLPLLHVVDATAQALRADGVTVVGLLGTRPTMELPFYAERLEAQGLRLRVPGAAARGELDALIFQQLCHNRVTPEATAWLREAVAALARDGAERVVLGCTELGLALPETAATAATAVPLLDSARVHAQAAVAWLTAQSDPLSSSPTAS